jgi:hypothetical protein
LKQKIFLRIFEGLTTEVNLNQIQKYFGLGLIQENRSRSIHPNPHYTVEEISFLFVFFFKEKQNSKYDNFFFVPFPDNFFFLVAGIKSSLFSIFKRIIIFWPYLDDFFNRK